MHVAIVGAGVAGLTAAWLISQRFRVTVFEAAPRLGGHADTEDVPRPDGTTCPVDTGFIVYNTANYPNLIALFDRFGVETAETRMSFAVSRDGGRYEYSGGGLRGLFGQPGNIASPKHLAMVRDIFRFFRDAKALRHDARAALRSGDAGPALGDWLADRNYSQAFVERHIIPMGAAIWSTPAADMMAFPAAAFARFFANHGLLQVRDRPAWRTVRGGSRNYVAKLRAAIAANGGTFATGEAVTSVAEVAAHRVQVATAAGVAGDFDACLIAAHADDAAGMLTSATERQRALLSPFRYSENVAVLHQDPTLMPRRKRLWSCWNYMAGETPDALSVSYWMNALQPLDTSEDWFVTLNPLRPVDPARVHVSKTYRHPMYDGPAISAQRHLWSAQGDGGVWLAGSYFGYGFHEDAAQSGLAAAEHLSATLGAPVVRPWQQAGYDVRLNDRLALPEGGPTAGVTPRPAPRPELTPEVAAS